MVRGGRQMSTACNVGKAVAILAQTLENTQGEAVVRRGREELGVQGVG